MLLQSQELFLIGRVYKKLAILKKGLPLTDFWCFDEIHKYTSLIYMKTKTKIFIFLILFAIFDLIIPFPITAVVLLYVFFKRPVWFKEYVKDIYDIKEP